MTPLMATLVLLIVVAAVIIAVTMIRKWGFLGGLVSLLSLSVGFAFLIGILGPLVYDWGFEHTERALGRSAGLRIVGQAVEGISPSFASELTGGDPRVEVVVSPPAPDPAAPPASETPAPAPEPAVPAPPEAVDPPEATVPPADATPDG